MKYLLIAFSLFLFACTPDQVSIINLFNTDRLVIQTFTIDPATDTILYGKDGTELHINKNTFAGTAPIQIELKEAIQLEDIVLANLHTLATDNEILSSNGMIHLAAKDANGKELQLEKDQSIKVIFPNAGMREGLKVFQGISQDGQIRWQESGELENIGMLDSLAIGQELFEANCAPCHSSNLRVDATGPALGNVHLFRERQWIRDFTRNSQKMIADGDSLAMCLWQDWKPTVMNSFNSLNDQEIDLIYQYIANESILQKIDTNEVEYVTKCYINPDAIQEQEDWLTFLTNLTADTSITLTFEPWPALFNTMMNSFEAEEVGWFNIDRFLNDSRAKPRAFYIKINTFAYDEVYPGIIFPRDQSFISTIWQDKDLHYFSKSREDRTVSFPIGEPAIIIATAQKGDQYFFGYKAITYGDNEIEELELKESSEKEIEEMIRRIL
ncbi:MAG: cytochrome c [Bacteroidota bacterium]